MQESNLNEDLGARARFAHQFVQTPYGANVIERMATLAYNRHELAEAATTAEQAYALVREAAGIREAMNLIVAEAQLEENGTLKQMEQAEKQQEDAALAM